MAPRRERDMPRIPSSNDTAPHSRQRNRDYRTVTLADPAESIRAAGEQIYIRGLAPGNTIAMGGILYRVTDVTHDAIYLTPESDSGIEVDGAPDPPARSVPMVSAPMEEQPTPRNPVDINFEGTEAVRRHATTRPPGWWKLRDGRLIEMRQMDDQHLENCINLCQRNALNRGRRPNEAFGSYAELIAERTRRQLEARNLEQDTARLAATRPNESGQTEEFRSRVQGFLAGQTPAGRRLFNQLTARSREEAEQRARQQQQQSANRTAAIQAAIQERERQEQERLTGRFFTPGLSPIFPMNQVATPIPPWETSEPEPEKAPTHIPEGTPVRRIKSK